MCLLLALTSISIAFGQELNIKNFKVTSRIGEKFSFNSGDRFEYEFDIKGDYTVRKNGVSEINLKVYYNNVNSENLIGVIRWNREDDFDNIYPNFGTKKMWVNPGFSWSGRSFTIKNNDKFILVAKYGNTQKTYRYTTPGLTRPTRPVTPPTPSGEPKLTLDKNQTTVFSDCSSCSFVNDRHLLRGFISSFNISASIRNTGNAASNNTTLEFYGSRDTKLDSGDKNAFRDVRIPSLRPNNVGGGSVFISASDIIFDTFTPGNYNLLFVIDGKVIGSVPFRFSATASGFKTLSSLEEKNKPKQLKIFDLTGRIILEKTIESEDGDEETIKNELNAGLYIIKSGNKSYKIYKN